MVRLIKVFIVLSILIPSFVFAQGPYLVCDPMNHVEYFALVFDGNPEPVPYQEMTFSDGMTHAFLKDLFGINNGSHHVEVYADFGVWGQSDTVPFDFTKPDLQMIQNIKLVK